MFNYPEASLKARVALLTTYGLPFSVQERIGAFIVIFGRIEPYLEWSIWSLQGKSPKGERPGTDTKNITALIADCRAAVTDHPDICEVVQSACDATEDLAMYRNAIAHGYLLPAFSATQTENVFTTNLRWHGELRKRGAQDAHVDENLLDLAIYAADIAAKVMMSVYFLFREPDQHTTEIVRQHLTAIRRARGYANELRHLTSLMNSEKY